ncbi:N-acetylglucosamine-6-phosphate deacetylase [Rubrolithibacter danxiaensis]|uniref:N-acetylglucosamine-6-phosphate deacetylase n=1 Tax=Rubrolithibacter danxiaensis TaxID=3390805 RepID=UPI003BF8C28D
MITALYNCILISDGREIPGKAVLIQNGKILSVVNEEEIPESSQRTDLNGAYLSPGLLDLQIYGSGGKLFSGTPSVEALQQMENDLIKGGTTGFFATVATNSNIIVEQAISAARTYRERAKGNFLGIHLEGPYLNAKKKGAHPEEYIKKATLEELKRWIDSAEGEIRMITVAPELQDAEILSYLSDQQIIVSCGHSNATFEEGMSFLNNPVPAATHLFNAMPQMHHREPGLIPAIFEKKPFVSIVADGTHVNFNMIRLAKRELGDRLFLITDAVTETREGTQHHTLKGDHYVLPNGTLSGSCLTMLKAVKNCVQQVGISLPEAINMASLYPAKLIKEDNLRGKIEGGYKADLLAFDKDFDPVKVFFNGLEV